MVGFKIPAKIIQIYICLCIILAGTLVQIQTKIYIYNISFVKF